MGAFPFLGFASCTGSGGSSTGRSNSDAFARRRSCSCCTCSMCRVATWLTIRSAGSGCSSFGSSYSILGRFLIAVIIPRTVIFRLVISSSASAASSTITAPALLIISSSVCARSPATTPAQLPSSPPSQRSASMEADQSAPSCPPTSCTSAPMVTASSMLHVTRSATGLPSCSSRIRKPITNENGSMYKPLPMSPRNREISSDNSAPCMPRQPSVVHSASTRQMPAPTSRRTGVRAFAFARELFDVHFRLPEDFPVVLPPETRFFVCFSAIRLRPFRKSGTAAASQAPRPSNNNRIRRIFRAGQSAAESRWQSNPTQMRRRHPPDTSAHSSTPRRSRTP